MLKILIMFFLDERGSALMDGVSFFGGGKMALGFSFFFLLFLKGIAF
jgi:hypothetical protein